MKKNNINTVINANAKGNNVMNNEAHIVFPYEYNRALAAKNRRNENRVTLADAMDRHNELDLDGLRCKANNLCLNMLRKGKLSNYSRNDVSRVINNASLVDLIKCENQSGFNTDKLLLFVGREIAKAKKAAKKNNKK